MLACVAIRELTLFSPHNADFILPPPKSTVIVTNLEAGVFNFTVIKRRRSENKLQVGS